ncbi:hypothetical protein AcV7_009729 [Taiwanofungus camphoratus]|nr:hypothetical protein AcV7_009729 [Antrodia cinnamomea]
MLLYGPVHVLQVSSVFLSSHVRICKLIAIVCTLWPSRSYNLLSRSMLPVCQLHRGSSHDLVSSLNNITAIVHDGFYWTAFGHLDGTSYPGWGLCRYDSLWPAYFRILHLLISHSSSEADFVAVSNFYFHLVCDGDDQHFNEYACI